MKQSFNYFIDKLNFFEGIYEFFFFFFGLDKKKAHNFCFMNENNYSWSMIFKILVNQILFSNVLSNVWTYKWAINFKCQKAFVLVWFLNCATHSSLCGIYRTFFNCPALGSHFSCYFSDTEALILFCHFSDRYRIYF